MPVIPGTIAEISYNGPKQFDALAGQGLERMQAYLRTTTGERLLGVHPIPNEHKLAVINGKPLDERILEEGIQIWADTYVLHPDHIGFTLHKKPRYPKGYKPLKPAKEIATKEKPITHEALSGTEKLVVDYIKNGVKNFYDIHAYVKSEGRDYDYRMLGGLLHNLAQRKFIRYDRESGVCSSIEHSKRERTKKIEVKEESASQELPGTPPVIEEETREPTPRRKRKRSSVTSKKPLTLTERAAEFITEHPGITQNGIYRGLELAREFLFDTDLRRALKPLLEEGYRRTQSGPKGKWYRQNKT